MLVEFSIIPMGGDTHMSAPLAEALKVVDDSGLPYQLTPSGTCVEGEWSEIMALIRECHERVRETSPHVMTLINIEDEEGASDKLRSNVVSIEEKAGRPLKKVMDIDEELVA